MSKPSKQWQAQGYNVFRGIEYIVSMTVEDDKLVLQTEDRLTADQWRGNFDEKHIEDLTHQTGNFKQFNIFVSMLESAISKSSDSVSLDLLTYSDLEALRDKKSGAGSRNVPGAKKAMLSTKRYLILTYNVEFDRIHYPLPLPYVGKPDPVALQEEIRCLRDEARKLRSDQGGGDYRGMELTRLQKDYDRLMQEKKDIEREFDLHLREVRNTSKGNSVKEIKILKNVIKNLEEEILKEKSKNQHSSNRHNQEYKNLIDELDEARSNERNLRVRVKSLTNELGLYRKGRSGKFNISNNSLSSQQSRNRVAAKSGEYRSRSTSRNRERPPSRDTRPHSRERPSNTRSRTPSPAGSRNPRFDPTAFIKEKQRKKKEMDDSRRHTRGSTNDSLSRSRSSQRKAMISSKLKTRSRSPSVGSVGSRGSRVSSTGSWTDMIDSDNDSRSRKIDRKPRRTTSASSWNSPGVCHSSKDNSDKKSRDKRLSSTPITPPVSKALPSHDRSKNDISSSVNAFDSEYLDKEVSRDFYDRSAEMSEIDARLNALQEFMKNNL